MFGLKSDLEHVIQQSEIEGFMLNYGITSYYTYSAKNTDNINVRKILEKAIGKFKLCIANAN